MPDCDSRIDCAEWLRHAVAFANEATSTHRAKPAGVRGAQVCLRIDDPAPVDPSELAFPATDTRRPHLAEFDGADAKRVAHYLPRWESTRGETGPWSETVREMVGA